jgi:hypothetical protein
VAVGGVAVPSSFANDLDQYPLPAASVKLTAEDPLPGAKVQTTIRHRNYHFASHDLQREADVFPASRGVGIILTRAVVEPASGPATAGRRMGGWVQSAAHLRQPLFVICVQATLGVVTQKNTVARQRRGVQSC